MTGIEIGLLLGAGLLLTKKNTAVLPTGPASAGQQSKPQQQQPKSSGGGGGSSGGGGGAPLFGGRSTDPTSPFYSSDNQLLDTILSDYNPGDTLGYAAQSAFYDQNPDYQGDISGADALSALAGGPSTVATVDSSAPDAIPLVDVPQPDPGAATSDTFDYAGGGGFADGGDIGSFDDFSEY